MANSVDPGQTAPYGAVWPGPALLSQTCLSLRIFMVKIKKINVNEYSGMFFCFLTKGNSFVTVFFFFRLFFFPRFFSVLEEETLLKWDPLFNVRIFFYKV